MPRSCSAARQCHRGGRRRFHRHAAPPGDAPWRCRLVPFSRTVPEYGRVLTRPSTSAAPDQRCAMCPRRPSCPRLTARRATPPTPPPSRPGWGRARAWRTFRCGRWSGPFAGPPPPSTATGLVGDHLVAIRTGHRAAFTQAARATASRARRLGRLVRRRPGHHYPRPVASPGLALPGRYRAGGAGPGQPLPAGRGRRPRRCGPGHTRCQPAQPAADAPPDRRLHGRTVAQALGDANVCYNPSPASDGLRRIRRPRRQAAGLPAVPARS